jgi:hypothetical protein
VIAAAKSLPLAEVLLIGLLTTVAYKVQQRARADQRGAQGARREERRTMTVTAGMDRTRRRRELCTAAVTLDGAPAMVCGVQERFATVATLDGKWSAEWAWETVARIVADGGAFFL